ncbi:MAG: HEPN domain-containing protein [Firmicutes bacterium]|nr:HEPN domain-containing protein [Bacillota bacterium]
MSDHKEAEKKIALIAYRLRQAQEALDDARKLAEHAGSLRSIINRAYYSMFYAVLALLLTIDAGASKHSGAIALFDRHFVKTGLFPKELSKILHRGFEHRQRGDYEELAEVEEADAQEMLQDAGSFLTAVRTYLKTYGIND